MTYIAELFNPGTAIGSIAINIVAGVGVVVVLGVIAWLGGPLRWLVKGRALKQLLNGRKFVFVFNPTHGQAKVVTFLPSGEVGEGRNSNNRKGSSLAFCCEYNSRQYARLDPYVSTMSPRKT